MATMLTPDVAIQTVLDPLQGQTYNSICGSGLAAFYYGKEGIINGIPVYNDIDVFVPSEVAFGSTIQILKNANFIPVENMQRRWERWNQVDTGGWHTNSMVLMHPTTGVEANVVYKTMNRQSLPDLSAVINTFDFGYLGCGITSEDGVFRRMYDYHFPGQDPKGPLGMMPRKEDEWKDGLFSRHVGLRESGRLARSVKREYQMEKIIPVMQLGYQMAALYYEDTDDEERQWYHKMYVRIAECIDWADWDELLEYDKLLRAPDPVASIIQIMEGRP